MCLKLRFTAILFFPLVLLSQTPTTYKKAGDLLNSSFEKGEFTAYLNAVLELPIHRDSLDILAPKIIEVASGLKGYASLKANQYLANIYSNYYGDQEVSYNYLKKEKEFVLARDSLPSYFLTGILSREIFLLDLLERNEQAEIVANQVLQRLENESNDLQKVFFYRQLCVFHQSNFNLERGLKVCGDGLNYAISSGEMTYSSSFFETIALLLSMKGDVSIDSIIALRRKGIKYAYNSPLELTLRVNYRNLAEDFSMHNATDSAEKYYAKSFEFFKIYPWLQGEIMTSISYAQHLLRNENTSAAITLLDSITPIAEENFPDELHKVYKSRAILEALSGRIRASEDYLQKSDSVIAHISSGERLDLQEKYRVKYETQLKESENLQLKAENRLNSIQLLFISIIALGLLLIIFLLFQRRKRDKQLAESKQELLRFKATEAEKQINLEQQRRVELQNELKQVINQRMNFENRNLELLELVEELRSGSESAFINSKAKQIKLKLQKYSSQDNLAVIEEKANQTYPELIDFLTRKLQSKKNIELLYCIMLVMNYSQEDIARNLKRTEKAVKSLRYRVRKKLGLEENEDLRNFLQNYIK